MTKSDLQTLQQLVVKFRDDRDWKQFHNPKDMAISMSLEASEFLEHFQWKNSSEIAEHVKKNKDDVSDELADVMYWVLLIANDLNINLEESFVKKLNKNAAKYPIEKAKSNHKKYTEYNT
jgi:dCTP diphosphatase